MMVGRGHLLRPVDEGHGFLREVAAVGDGPVVVLFEQDGADEAVREARRREKVAHDVDATLEALMSRGVVVGCLGAWFW